ncbi:hypothetical protein GWO43_09560 [candidate division KSB1 bacterium]|nr:hypothetical protein [candidate division KSB1 bacterium]NIR69415.1 hypothetical protein [candidate division KSB1 bacterium]NIS24213.1 hypothetical protein [candidate division KSB1 bacterium]NIT71127.1 hypothetical protein [candidate division KSB1 bacterium]NIU24832.1 hypothetical protein [candidate division KSB1 bacterium]
MKWVLIVLGILVGLFAIVYLVGTLLPKSHVATSSAKFKTSPEEVWKIITDFAAAPTWREGLKSMEQLPDRNGHAVWAETSKFGQMTYEITEFDPPHRMVTQIGDDNLPFGGNWSYELSAVEGGTKLTITENGEIYNPMFRFMARFVFGYHGTMDGYLKSLGEKLGEETVIVRS